MPDPTGTPNQHGALIPCWSATEFGCVQTRYRGEFACLVETAARSVGIDPIEILKSYLAEYGDPFERTKKAVDDLVQVAFESLGGKGDAGSRVIRPKKK